jgi:hypothetical protein
MRISGIRTLLLWLLVALGAGVVGAEWLARRQEPPTPPPNPVPTVDPASYYYEPDKRGELVFTAIDPSPPDRSGATGQAAEDAVPTRKKWQKYEVRFELTWRFANPYDPTEIAVDAVFTTPSGAVETVPAFWYVPCESQIVDRRERVRNPDEDMLKVESIHRSKNPDSPHRDAGTWMLRYTPREEGKYVYRLVATTPEGSAYSVERTFEVAGSAGRGFVRVSEQDPRYFSFSDGSFFFPVGQNVAWPNDRGSVDFKQYLANMEHAGANWARLWLTSYFKGTTIEWSRKDTHYYGLGFYSPEIAWKLDRMLEAAEEHGIYLMWCLQQHAQFATGDGGCWDENPYNRAVGGFLDDPEEFFIHPRAQQLFKRRMRYHVARYGYSPHLLAWEFWNEVALTDRFSGPVCTAWHKKMGDYVKRLDPTGRLVTTSYHTRFDNDAYRLSSHDFAQVHIYGGTFGGDLVDWIIYDVGNHRTYGKPVLIGEFGLGHDSSYFTIEADSEWPVDPCGLHIHNGLWAGLFSGSAGTAMPWWWDHYIHKNNLYFHFTGISRFMQDEDLRPYKLKLVKLFEDRYRTPEFKCYVLAGPERAYGWVYQTAWTIEHFNPGPKPKENVRLVLENLDDGPCWVEFWDTYDGVVTWRCQDTVEDGSLTIRVPPFRGDVAFKLFREEPGRPVKADTPIHDQMVKELQQLAARFPARSR